MFTSQQRVELRDQLVDAARADPRITAAAVLGSAAIGGEDPWSDIDLAVRLDASADQDEVIADWTRRLYDDHGAVQHLDVHAGGALYRVFLLSSTLQVDLSFWPDQAFAASGPTFRLLFGEANEPTIASAPRPDDLVGMAWLYGLHARSSIARRRCLQAVHMINGMRDQIVALACLRHDVPSSQGRGVDDLPRVIHDRLVDTLVRSAGRAELVRSFGATAELLLDEARELDQALADSLSEPVRELVRTSGP